MKKLISNKMASKKANQKVFCRNLSSETPEAINLKETSPRDLFLVIPIENPSPWGIES